MKSVEKKKSAAGKKEKKTGGEKELPAGTAVAVQAGSSRISFPFQQSLRILALCHTVVVGPFAGCQVSLYPFSIVLI